MNSEQLRACLTAAPIIPILTVRSIGSTLDQIAALAEAGVTLVEIVFRTPEAAAALREARQAFPALKLAAGTMLSAATVASAVEAGADFLVSPGLTPALEGAVKGTGHLLVPGAQTASEVMAANELGYEILKFYPAAASNGDVVLADYANIFPGTRFVPTGKITMENLAAFAALPNVAGVGGSFMLGSDHATTLARTLSALAAFKARR